MVRKTRMLTVARIGGRHADGEAGAEDAAVGARRLEAVIEPP